MSGSKARDDLSRATVAFQGEVGAYSTLAIGALFDSAHPVGRPSLHQVFETVEIGAADFGVVPIENSHAGSINDSYDLLVNHGVQIAAETIVRISHSLLALPGMALEDVTTVYSHPQALEQSSEFLDALGVEKVAFPDTAGAAKLIAEEGRQGAAAVASELAADAYGLQVIATGIEDRPDNSTKFVVIGRGSTDRFGPAEKTSIVFATPDVPGALYRCLGEFASREINLSKLESRPSRRKAWQYLFYLDFDRPASDNGSQEALSTLAEHTSFLRVLGSYPRAREPLSAPGQSLEEET